MSTSTRDDAAHAGERASAAPRRTLGPTLALVAVLVAPAALVYAWSMPVAAPPTEVPPLVLDPDEVAAQIARDDIAARSAPSGEAADERLRLYHETNVAEQEGREPPVRARERRESLVSALASAAPSDEAREALRASDLGRLEPALAGALPRGDAAAELGGFLDVMRRYGLVRGRQQVAPRFVVRTLFKARWNAMHDRELTEGLSPVELRAYHGWLALRAEEAAPEQRLEAIERYAEAGGARADEARGVLFYDQGRLEDAREAFERAYSREPTFRLRNHALACAQAE